MILRWKSANRLHAYITIRYILYCYRRLKSYNMGSVVARISKEEGQEIDRLYFDQFFKAFVFFKPGSFINKWFWGLCYARSTCGAVIVNKIIQYYMFRNKHIKYYVIQYCMLKIGHSTAKKYLIFKAVVVVIILWMQNIKNSYKTIICKYKLYFQIVDTRYYFVFK